ncbi:hypothetical protein KSF_021070 [Reticulibacter mediterranei]|uniref:Uncharacterized protein n=1 Tax=Reticulibacter mediterranei TaxID=2778369 RepID=A0A8J3IIL4_9CHLR|nr:hypothetical protein KSF_021070 [Reticulibacter mediterranei]
MVEAMCVAAAGVLGGDWTGEGGLGSCDDNVSLAEGRAIVLLVLNRAFKDGEY